MVFRVSDKILTVAAIGPNIGCWNERFCFETPQSIAVESRPVWKLLAANSHGESSGLLDYFRYIFADIWWCRFASSETDCWWYTGGSAASRWSGSFHEIICTRCTRRRLSVTTPTRIVRTASKPVDSMCFSFSKKSTKRIVYVSWYWFCSSACWQWSVP